MEDKTKNALDALCDSYELEIYALDSAIDRVRNYCNEVILDGMGVDVTDPRFTARLFAHMVLKKLDGEQ